MAEKKPLCNYSGDIKELQSGDTLPSSGSGLPDTFEGTAGEALSQYDVVYPNSADSGEHWIATNDGTSEQADAVGIVIESGGISDTATGTILRFGPLTNESWTWTPGATLWLGTDGAMTETMPSAGNYAKPLGYAETATKIWFAPQNGWLVGYDIDLTEVPPRNDGRITLVSTTQVKWDGYGYSGWDATKGRDVEIIPSSTPVLNYNDLDIDGNALVAAYPYDVYLETVSATSAVMKAKKFTNATTRAVSPALWHGRYRYDNTTDAGKKRLWIGTVYLDTGPVFKDASNTRFIWNKYNQKEQLLGKVCPYTSSTSQNTSGSWTSLLTSAYKTQYVLGETHGISLSGALLIDAQSRWNSAALGIDQSITSASPASGVKYQGMAVLVYANDVAPGYHWVDIYIYGPGDPAYAWLSTGDLFTSTSLVGTVVI